MEHVEASDLIAEVRRVAAERPDYNYREEIRKVGFDDCVYQLPNGEPGCLIGQGLFPLMEDKNIFSEFPGLNEDDVEGLEVAGLIDGTEREIAWLSRAQIRQDAGFTWSEAVAVADCEYPLS